ncbi:MAG: hypothetical protein JSS76_02850 [Bacteroidetes bacterium]|nr:hypothetical protein [Bacteroidota bacterium]
MAESPIKKAGINQIKSIAKSKGWKFNAHSAFKVYNKFFYELMFIKNYKENVWVGIVLCKPMAIDEYFWTIVPQLENNKKLPLSFRSVGIYVMPPVAIGSFSIQFSDIEDMILKLPKLFENLQSLCDQNIEKIKTYDDFLEILGMQKEQQYSDAILTMMVIQNRYSEALLKCKEYIQKQIRSTYFFDTYDYYYFVQKYCLEKLDLPSFDI